jgi:hypothetical protein
LLQVQPNFALGKSSITILVTCRLPFLALPSGLAIVDGHGQYALDEFLAEIQI